jgi:CRISPR/Cas system-associated exonuclease Cas4 (RecB family)
VDHRPQDRPVPPSWRFGSVVHEGLEAAYRHALDHPEATRAERAREAVAAVDRSWGRHDLGEEAGGRQRAVWHVTRALAADVLQLADARILGVEHPFRDRFSDVDRLIGFADLVLERPDGTIEIVDHKVTRHRSRRDALREDLQLNLYGWLARRQWPAATRIVATHHYPTGPAAVSVELDPQRMTAAAERVRAAAALIADDTAFRPTPGERCAHCPWQPSCPEGTAFLGTGTSTPQRTGQVAPSSADPVPVPRASGDPPA